MISSRRGRNLQYTTLERHTAQSLLTNQPSEGRGEISMEAESSQALNRLQVAISRQEEVSVVHVEVTLNVHR